MMRIREAFAISKPNSMNTADNGRYHAIDNLRAGMISVVMFGHALLPYLTVPRRFKDSQTHLGFDVVAIFLPLIAAYLLISPLTPGCSRRTHFRLR